jgi:hypothetical protein
MIRIGSIVLRVDDLQRQTIFSVQSVWSRLWSSQIQKT